MKLNQSVRSCCCLSVWISLLSLTISKTLSSLRLIIPCHTFIQNLIVLLSVDSLSNLLAIRTHLRLMGDIRIRASSCSLYIILWLSYIILKMWWLIVLVLKSIRLILILIHIILHKPMPQSWYMLWLGLRLC